MPIGPDTVKRVTAQLYDRSLRGIPADAKAALHRADAVESNPTARHTLRLMLQSAEAAERTQHFVCSDAGVPASRPCRRPSASVSPRRFKALWGRRRRTGVFMGCSMAISSGWATRMKSSAGRSSA